MSIEKKKERNYIPERFKYTFTPEHLVGELIDQGLLIMEWDYDEDRAHAWLDLPLVNEDPKTGKLEIACFILHYLVWDAHLGQGGGFTGELRSEFPGMAFYQTLDLEVARVITTLSLKDMSQKVREKSLHLVKKNGLKPLDTGLMKIVSGDETIPDRDNAQNARANQ